MRVQAEGYRLSAMRTVQDDLCCGQLFEDTGTLGGIPCRIKEITII